MGHTTGTLDTQSQKQARLSRSRKWQELMKVHLTLMGNETGRSQGGRRSGLGIIASAYGVKGRGLGLTKVTKRMFQHTKTHLRPPVGGGLGLVCSMAVAGSSIGAVGGGSMVAVGGGSMGAVGGDSMAAVGGGSMAGGGSGGVGGGGRGVATGRFWMKSVLDVCF